jgi:hypothetical protein
MRASAAARFCRVFVIARILRKSPCNLVHTAVTVIKPTATMLFARRVLLGQSRGEAAQAFGNHAATEPPLISSRLGGAGDTTRGRRDGARSG